MAPKDQEPSFAEDVSASLSKCLEEIGDQFDKHQRDESSRPASRKSTVSAPTADGMEEALGSPINQVLGQADGGFLAGLLDSDGMDDPELRDYGERYEYRDIIGEGGQGKVLRFRDTVLDRDVAIKVVKAPFTTDREKLLENEARLGGMLEHPNILPTYDLCRDETGSPFFVMKKVEGVSFDELLKKAHAEGDIHNSRDRGEYSRRRLLNVFLQVCHAIQYAHSRGVFHLDLKPQNVKLGPFGEVYVLDWGFASRIEDNPKMVAGTPLYIAPERFKPGKPDARCDIYSLGVMLYRILVNQLPRDVGKTSFKEFRKRIKDFPIVPPRLRDPSLPRDLEAIIMKALAENPDNRYQNVGELAGDLERFLDILPVTAYREGVWGRTMKFIRRHRATVFAATALFVAIAFTAGASIRARRLAVDAEILMKKEKELAEAQRREEREEAAGKLRLAEEARRTALDQRRTALEQQKKADEMRRLAEEARLELLRRRAAARVPMEKGMDIMDKAKSAVDKERGKTAKLRLMQPAIDFFTQAIAVLEEGNQDKQDTAGAYYARARAYEHAHEFDKAVDDYRTAYTLDQSYIMAHYYLGMLYFNVRENEQKAMDEFTAMNAIDPGNEFSEVGQAYIDVHRGRDVEALERVDRIEKKEMAARGEETDSESWRNAGLSNVWLIRGRVYGNKQGGFYDPEKGIEAYSNYLLFDRGKPSPYTNRGVLHEAMYIDLRQKDPVAAEKHFDAAMADYAQALTVDPSYKLALQHRGYALFKYKNLYEESLRDIEAALEIDPKYVTVIMDRAAIHEKLQKYDLAEKDYESIREIHPRHPNLDYRLGILHLYTGELAKSEAAFDKSIDLASGPASLGVRHHRRGIIRFLRNDYPGAVEDFDKSLALRTSGKIYPALMRYLAQIRLGEKPDQEAFAKMVDVGAGEPWLAAVASVYLGDDPFGEDRAMRMASTPEAVCETGFYLGARAWVRGETVNALYFLDKSVNSGEHLYMEYSMAKILSQRLTKRQEESKQLPDTVGLPPPPPTVPALTDPIEADSDLNPE